MHLSVRHTRLARYLAPLLSILASLIVGSVFILMAGAHPLRAYGYLARAGFGCQGPGIRCATLTALQFSTPLLLSGLSATVAFRTGFFSIGQYGQMLLGGVVAAWIGSHLSLPPLLHPLLALAGGVLCGAGWAGVAGVLKEWLGINEVIVTLVMNQLAVLLVRLVWIPRIEPSARLLPLIEGTRLSGGFILALLAAALIYLYLWHFAGGYEQRMAGQAHRFARFGGIFPRRAVIRAVLLSGGLAGLGGAVEVLGVHYRFVTSFSADSFDGLVVALLGQLHPLGVVLSAVFLGGVRLGALNGLQLQAHIPRELGGALIAMMLLFVSSRRLFRLGAAHPPELRD